MRNYRTPVSSDRRFKIKRISQDKGPEERWQHSTQQIKHVEEEQALVAYVMEESIVDILCLHNLITKLEREAAHRFRADFMCAGLAPRTVASYGPRADGGGAEHDRTEAEEGAYKRWRGAMVTMTGAVNGVVESVVCYEQMPATEKVAFLRVGLKKLIKLYGISGCDSFLNDKVNKATAGQVTVRRRVSRQSGSRA